MVKIVFALMALASPSMGLMEAPCPSPIEMMDEISAEKLDAILEEAAIYWNTTQSHMKDLYDVGDTEITEMPEPYSYWVESEYYGGGMTVILDDF